jgi:hypothetical protein
VARERERATFTEGLAGDGLCVRDYLSLSDSPVAAVAKNRLETRLELLARELDEDFRDAYLRFPALLDGRTFMGASALAAWQAR